MYAFSKKSLAKALNFLLIFAIIISLLGFGIDLRNTLKTGGIDLRNRVVGARLLIRGMDPYYFKWSQGQDERLLDPLDLPYSPVSRVTVPPSVLLLQSTLARLPYFHQRLIWLILQWAAFITSLFILTKNKINPLQNKLLLNLGLLFVSGNPFWRLHIDVGQIYVFYVLLISLSYWILNKKIKLSDFMGGCLIGLAASLRPPLIIMVLPMIIFKKFKILACTLLGFCLCLFASIAITGQQVWASYFSAMRTIGNLNIGKTELFNNSVNNVLPSTIEGMNILTTKAPIISLFDSSFQTLFKEFLNVKLHSNYLVMILCIVLLIYSGMVSFFYKKEIHSFKVLSWDAIFIFGTLMILIVELFIPAPRLSYNNIQFLIPLILIVKNLDFSNNRVKIYLSFLMLGLFLSNVIFPWIPYSTLAADYIIITTMIVMSLIIVRKMPVTENAEIQ